MREIKFRAWDESRGKFYSSAKWVEFRFTNGGVKAFNYNRAGKEVELPVYQFTGLLDKNGVEIYEGDVVKFKSRMDSAMGVIEYSESETRFVFNIGTFNEKDFRDVGHGWYGAEVLGNIHEK